jgi:carbohydrate diacid regulator
MELSEDRCKIILYLADNKMNVSAVARQLYMHRNTVDYHIRRIKQITGKDPLNFYDLYILVLLVKEEMAERWLREN